MLEKTILNNFKGLNRLSSRMNMDETFAWDICNGYIKKDAKYGFGVITQRKGVSVLNDVAFSNPCKYIFEAKWNGGGTDLLIREGTRWAMFDGVDTFVSIDTGRTSGVRGQAVMFDNEVIMADGGYLRKMTASYDVSNLIPNGGVKTVDITATGIGYLS